PVVWDYHVVCLEASEDGARTWDLDCSLPIPSPALAWFDAAIGPSADVPLRFQPHFRLVEASRWLAEFASDRRHMRDSTGEWLQPPPPWPTIGQGFNLDEFLDLDEPG